MSTYEVLTRYGTAALLRFAALVGLFVALHLLRAPFLAIARALDAAMQAVDAAATTRVSTPDPRSDHRPGGKSRQERTARAGVSRNQMKAETGGQSW